MVGVVKDKIGLFKTNTTKNYSKLPRANNAYGGQEKPRKTKNKKQIIRRKNN